jgi:hypothetical protein
LAFRPPLFLACPPFDVFGVLLSPVSPSLPPLSILISFPSLFFSSPSFLVYPLIFFSGGTTASLATRLVKIPDLRILLRTSQNTPRNIDTWQHPDRRTKLRTATRST